jgi:hypothetical protein
MKWNNDNMDVLKAHIEEFFGNHPLKSEEIIAVEKALDVKLPKLFKELNSICSYEYASLFSFFNFGRSDANSVISATLGIREKYTNSQNNIVLYLDDAGIVLLNTSDKNAKVIWCSVYDLDNYFSEQPLAQECQLFNTFADFFKFLLDEEEKMRAEDMK